MFVRSQSFQPYDHLHPRLCFGCFDADTHLALSDNLNPHLSWGDLPEGTQSITVLCVDADVPSVGDDVNQEGRVLPIDLPRVDFFHWVLTDLPPNVGSIAEGAHCSGITPRGKPVGSSPDGGIQGINDYTAWFAGDADMGGDYGGYDGPCPPWNDERMHGYRFQVFALDVPSLGLSGPFSGHDVRAAMAGHILGQAEIIGLYTTSRPPT